MLKIVFMIYFLFSFIPIIGDEIKLKIYTEEYPPFNFIEDGEITGISTEIVHYLLDEVKLDIKEKEIKLVPWARAYNDTLNVKNAMIYSITFTESREAYFKWVGPILESKIVVFARKDRNIRIDSAKDLKKYSIGVVIEDIGQHLLRDAGISLEKIEKTSSAANNARKLNKDRIDLWAYSELSGFWALKKYTDNVNDFEVVYTLQKGHHYIAFNKRTPDKIINEFQRALIKLKTEDIKLYNSLIDKYIK